ncbi:hypothetical protein FRC01_003572, partial [Tulasnella sp. 417]
NVTHATPVRRRPSNPPPPPPPPPPLPLPHQENFTVPSEPEVAHDIPAAGPNTIEDHQRRSIDLEKGANHHGTGGNNNSTSPWPLVPDSTPEKVAVDPLHPPTKNEQQTSDTLSHSHSYQASRGSGTRMQSVTSRDRSAGIGYGGIAGVDWYDGGDSYGGGGDFDGGGGDGDGGGDGGGGDGGGGGD